jgi:photosystem II stability/assembly factor-like uncharacterized protein
MRQILMSVAIICAIAASAQKFPKPTTAAERLEGYKQRQALIEGSLVKNVPFRNVGPTIMSGRVVDLEVDPADPTHFYVAYASGGLWETKNNGTSFEPIFDNEIVMTLGDIAVDWVNNIIYAGSGENNSSRSSYSGFGMFKSDDNGKTWTHIGLNDSHHISRILIHPSDPNTLWVAVLGHLYSENEERGVYKSTDAGKTWKKTLYVNTRTGIVDLAMHPSNPNVLLAAAWEKDRKAWNFEEAGLGSGIFSSQDGGNTWKASMTGIPDTEGTGRIGLAFAPSDQNVVYAFLDNQDRKPADKKPNEGLTKEQLRGITLDVFLALENSAINTFLEDNNFPSKYNAVDLKSDFKSGKGQPKDLAIYLDDANSLLFDTPVKGGEMYRSNDAGKSWSKTHDGSIEDMVYSYGYYFGQVRVDGQNPDALYTWGVPIVTSKDGGKTWKNINKENVHVDHHALWVNPNRPGHLILGNDGGVNISYDDGATWIKCNSPSVGQFYAINVDMDDPYNVYGGLQDNGVWKGPSTYEYDRSWYEDGKYPYERLMGGDGMQVAVDTRDNATVYTGYQFGNYYRINTQTKERKYITPEHKLGESPFRWNWQAPILLSSHNQDIVYFGSNRFHRSLNKGDDFEVLSGDLTKGGKKGDVSYGTITTISESPKQFGLLYVGSDDGLVHVSKDAGQTWSNITGKLPMDFWVSRVTASAHQLSRVYLSLNGYRWDHLEAMVYVSNDFGTTWERIGLNLPKEPVNVIKEDPKNENILYVGTDHGVYVSMDRGKTFMAFNEGLPAVAVHDLVVHPRENDLVVGTHGRSIYIGNIGHLHELATLMPSSDLQVFALPEQTFSDRWGTKGWTWAEDFFEPKMSVVVYVKTGSKGTLKVMDTENSVLFTQEIDLDKGLNYLTYNLDVLDGTGNKKDNGKEYLPAGEYTLEITAAGKSSSQALKIKEARKRNERKE